MITKTKARTPAVCNFEATRKALLRAMRNAKEREHYDTVRSLACRCLEYCETGVRTGAKDIRERAVTGISEIAGESETMKLISKETRAAMIRTYSELLGDTSESVRVSAIKGLAQPELMLDCSGIILSRVTSNALRSREDFALATVIRAHSDGLRKVSEAGRRVNSTFEEKMERLAYLLHKKLDPGQTEERKMLVASMKRLGGNILPRIIEEFITSLVSTLREEAEK